MLGNGGEREAQSGRIHRLEHIFIAAALSSLDLSRWVFHVLRKRREIPVQTSAVGVGVLPFLFVFGYVELGLPEIPLNIIKFTVLLI